MNSVNMPKTKRGQETFEKIVGAAEILFSQKGYFNTSIVDIAQKAGIAQGTVYIYFKDKKSIFRYIVNNLDKNLRHEIRLAIADSENRLEKEKVGLKTFLQFVDKNVGIYKIIWQAQFVDMDLFKEYYESFSQSYVRALTNAQDTGEVRKLDPQILSYCLIGISNFIALKYSIFDDNTDYDTLVETVMDFIEKGAFINK